MPLISHPHIPSNHSKIHDGLPVSLVDMALTQSTTSFTTSTTTSSATTSQQQQQPSQTNLPSQQNLPSAQTFDILPALHELLARIDHSQEPGLQDPSFASVPGEIGAAYTEIQPLEPKDLPTEVLAVKARIRRALRELEKLPDMERSVEEQREEIEELEEKIRKQRGMMRSLGDVAAVMEARIGAEK